MTNLLGCVALIVLAVMAVVVVFEPVYHADQPYPFSKLMVIVVFVLMCLFLSLWILALMV